MITIESILRRTLGLALEYCMSQYGLYCYHSCQIWYWSSVCLSMDSIVIIAVRSGTAVLYVSVYNNRIHTETNNTPVPNLTAMLTMESMLRHTLLQCQTCSCQVWHWSIVCLSMDSIVIIAVRSGTGVLYVSVWIVLLS
jgi:hypothetical protein